MFKNKSVKNLLKANPKALRGLHKISGMDFSNVFLCMEFTENFTHKKILKIFNDYAKLIDNKNIEDYNVYILWEDSHWNDLFFAEVKWNKFNVTKDEINCNSLSYDYNLSMQWSKGGFEKIRKNPNIHWWLIAQPKCMAFKRNTKWLSTTDSDKYTRYHITEVRHYAERCGGQRYVGHVYVQQNHRRNDRPFDRYSTYYKVKAENLNEYIIDKSGYFKDNIRFNYTQRAEKLRASRAKQNVDSMNLIKLLDPVLSEISNLKTALMTASCTESTWHDSEKLDAVGSAMQGISELMEKIDNYRKATYDKNWKNYQEVEYALDNFDRRIKRIKDIISEGGIQV